MLFHPKNINQVFNMPVDPIALNLPDYFHKIKYPMDLGTVKSRLQKGFYRSVGGAIADINQVFKNAMIYNAPSHSIHQLAKMMKEDFDAEIVALEDKFAKDVSYELLNAFYHL
jgi:Bromodomain